MEHNKLQFFAENQLFVNFNDSNYEKGFNELEYLFERFSKFHDNNNHIIDSNLKLNAGMITSIFNEFVPIPHELLNSNSKELEKWCKKNWGTKWDALNVNVDIISHTIKFETIDSEPIEFFKNFSKDYPHLKIINIVKIKNYCEPFDTLNNSEPEVFSNNYNELFALYIYNGTVRKINFDNLKF